MSSPTSLQVRHGTATPTEDPAQALRDGADLVWTALVNPSTEEIGAAVEALGIAHELVMKAKADLPEPPPVDEPTRRRRPRLVEHGEARGVVLLTAAYDDPREEVQLGLLTVLVDGAAVLTIARGKAPDLSRVKKHLAGDHDHSGALLEAVVAEVLEDYDDVLEQLDDDVADVEQQVFSPDRASHAQRIYGLKRETLELQRAVAPLTDVVDRLNCSRPLHERVMRASEHVERLDALLDGVLSADLAQVGVRQNEDQRTISAWAAIALVPTIVAGIYGMNFQHMPELSWRFGYPMALGLIVVVCLTLRWGFHRHGWIGRSAEEGVHTRATRSP